MRLKGVLPIGERWHVVQSISINFSHIERKVMRLKKLWLYILTPLLVLLVLQLWQILFKRKNLKNVITKVGIWETDNGKFVTPDAKGVYNLAPQNQSYENYKFATDFDLSAYDGKLNDGDTFTFTIQLHCLFVLKPLNSKIKRLILL